MAQMMNSELVNFTLYNAARSVSVAAAQKADVHITGFQQIILPFLAAVEISINKGNDAPFSIS